MRLRTVPVVALAVLLVAGLATPVAAARPDRGPGRAADRALLEAMPAGITVSRERGTGLVRSVRGGRQALATGRELGGPRTPAAAGSAFLARYGGLYDLQSPGRELRVAGVERAGRAGSYVRYQQEIGGVPVMGGDLVVVVDGRMGVRAVRGETTRDRSVETRPRIGPAEAARVARAAVARSTGVSATRLRAQPPTRWIYDPRLMDGPGLPFARLVWRTRVQDATGRVDQLVAVDARSGDVALRFDQLRAAAPPADANQRICDQEGKRESVRDRLPCTTGGRLIPPYAGEALKVAQATEATYDFFARRFGYDLPADLNAGAVLISTIRYCPTPAGGGCPYQNAFWDGSQMVYGAGFGAADDVVAHELTHAVTERASDLFYYMESGAISEALSDIFGEAVDLTDGIGSDGAAHRWRIGEDLPFIGAIRDMADPGAFGHPDSMDSPLYDDDPQETDSGGVHSNSGVANKAFSLMVDGTSNGTTVPPFDANPGVSLDQAVAVWYLAAARLLTTASDHADLADALQIACDQLASVADGVKDKHGDVSTPIDAQDDCGPSGTVRRAIEWTRMPLELRDPQPDRAPLCSDDAATPTRLLDDPITETGAGWTFDGGTDRRWFAASFYGFRDPTPADPDEPTWHLYGADLGRTADRRIRRTANLAIPTGPRPVYLWFRHAWGFDDGSEDVTPSTRGYDGGVVEVSVNGSAWTDISGLFLSGGPRGTIFKGDTNPLKGRRAFTAESRGYVTARALLSGHPGRSYAGSNVRLSFRIGTDSRYGGEGWFIDDVVAYTCVNNAENDAPDIDQVGVSFAPGRLGSDGRVAARIAVQADKGAQVATLGVATALGSGPQTTLGGAIMGVGSGSATVTGRLRTSGTPRSLEVRVTDENGDVGSTTLERHVRRLEESALTYGGAWATVKRSDLSGGAARSASRSGRTAAVTIADVRSVAVVATTGPDRGKARMCVDGTACRTIDLYSGTVATRRLVASWAFGGSADRTVTIEVLGRKRSASSGTRVDIDAVIAVTD